MVGASCVWELKGNAELTPLDAFIDLQGEIVPVYPAKGPMDSHAFPKVMRKALAEWNAWIDAPLPAPHLEVLPADAIAKYDLMGYREAMHAMHAPRSMDEAARARTRFVFQELYYLQVALAYRRHVMQAPDSERDSEGVCIGASPLLEAAKESLPYQLTEGQERVMGQIASDIAGAPPMIRLLQGDVGCGKTVVAMLAMVAAAGSGWQAAMMVPTEVLALQHAQKMREMLDGIAQSARDKGESLDVPKVVVLTGKAMKAKDRREALDAITDGSAALVIGTHALISEGVAFLRLGLAVIDEQHKFGVEQRSKLQSKGEPPPHILAMSATPIPRTLALTMYGEMDLSHINEMPPGRTPVHTRVGRQSDGEVRGAAYAAVASEVAKGHKAFVVFPLIDESESAILENVQAAETSFAALTQGEGELRDVPCGLLHGRLSPQEKLDAQTDFLQGKTKVRASDPSYTPLWRTRVPAIARACVRANVRACVHARVAPPTNFRLLLIAHASKQPGVACARVHVRWVVVLPRAQVLVATAVIEVGVDIPEATVMIVENAERFGLAQLHQLRGRVGRSHRPSRCFLLTGGTESSHDRIKPMEELDDGFAVADADMATRGPGDFIGTKQAGSANLSHLALCNLASEEDRLTMERARECALAAFGGGAPELPKAVWCVLEHDPPLPDLDVVPKDSHSIAGEML